jgi:hypothetical protein
MSGFATSTMFFPVCLLVRGVTNHQLQSSYTPLIRCQDQKISAKAFGHTGKPRTRSDHDRVVDQHIRAPWATRFDHYLVANPIYHTNFGAHDCLNHAQVSMLGLVSLKVRRPFPDGGFSGELMSCSPIQLRGGQTLKEKIQKQGHPWVDSVSKATCVFFGGGWSQQAGGTCPMKHRWRRL